MWVLDMKICCLKAVIVGCFFNLTSLPQAQFANISSAKLD